MARWQLLAVVLRLRIITLAVFCLFIPPDAGLANETPDQASSVQLENNAKAGGTNVLIVLTDSGKASSVKILDSNGDAQLNEIVCTYILKNWMIPAAQVSKLPTDFLGRHYAKMCVKLNLYQKVAGFPQSSLLSHPVYPVKAIRNRIQGTVGTRVFFGDWGTVSNVIITKSSGSPLLDANTRNWIRLHWQLSEADLRKTSKTADGKYFKDGSIDYRMN